MEHPTKKTLFLTASSHIFCTLKCSGTSFSYPGLTSTASIHIFCVLRRSRTYSNAYDTFLNNIITHFLRLIRNTLQLSWPFLNNIVTHFPHLKVIRDRFQHPSLFFFDYLDTHPLSFKAVRNKIKRYRAFVSLFYPAYNRHILF